MTRPALVMVPLAMNQTTFYVGVAERLRQDGWTVVFIPFHEASVEYVRARGFVALNPYEVEAADRGLDPFRRAEVYRDRFALDAVTPLLTHEKEAYETRSTRLLLGRMCDLLDGAHRLLSDLAREHSEGLVVVQELGGFLSVEAVFHAARALGLPHVFIEPSFFRGRVFFVKDGFGARSVDRLADRVSPEVRAYLEETARAQRIVIPRKDSHHYRHPIRKVLHRRNLRRLVEKSVEKHLLGRREEFSHIGGHVRRHVRAAATATRLRGAYQDVPGEPFVYYPLHVPADVALTVRAPEYLDQFALLDYLARVVPVTHKVVFKEHPAMIGAVRYSRVRELLDLHDNVVLLSPGINNYEVLRRADVVVTVNSKSGAEALLLGRPVVALGDSFYRRSPLVHAPAGLAELGGAIAQALAAAPYSPGEAERYFQAVWDASFPGELHDADAGNCERFAGSLAAYLADGRAG